MSNNNQATEEKVVEIPLFDAFEKKNWRAGPALQGLQTWDESKQNFFQSKFNFRVSAEGGEQYHG